VTLVWENPLNLPMWTEAAAEDGTKGVSIAPVRTDEGILSFEIRFPPTQSPRMYKVQVFTAERPVNSAARLVGTYFVKSTAGTSAALNPPFRRRVAP